MVPWYDKGMLNFVVCCVITYGYLGFFLIFSFLICKLTGLDLTAKISSIHCKLGLRSFKIGFVKQKRVVWMGDI